ncbi:DUF4286 family protein [Solitalea sp. MAHUQ-68]|uniref:DUF4286 family protein n=1 Tax=Solitalea agri TaxID=2953739 RepID=A0A9X2JCH1_9SPHI|nr:DUF4286 family protein [Solitalea agri]MCO4293467.1 DUF4286 family protein [Solitalea agri]
MVQFNVTINIEPEIVEEFLVWMRDKHIPDVMNTGIFKSYRIAELIAPVDPEQVGTTFSFQYFCETMNDYFKYEKEFAPVLRQEVTEKYGSKIVAFRSVMEILAEG